MHIALYSKYICAKTLKWLVRSFISTHLPASSKMYCRLNCIENVEFIILYSVVPIVLYNVFGSPHKRILRTIHIAVFSTVYCKAMGGLRVPPAGGPDKFLVYFSKIEHIIFKTQHNKCTMAQHKYQRLQDQS